jgi:hypothetical protein
MLVYHFLLSQPHRPARVAIQLNIRWVTAAKRCGHDVDTPPPLQSNAEVKFDWSCIFAVHIYLHGVDRGNSAVPNAPGGCTLFPSTSIKTY